MKEEADEKLNGAIDALEKYKNSNSSIIAQKQNKINDLIEHKTPLERKIANAMVEVQSWNLSIAHVDAQIARVTKEEEECEAWSICYATSAAHLAELWVQRGTEVAAQKAAQLILDTADKGVKLVKWVEIKALQLEIAVLKTGLSWLEAGVKAAKAVLDAGLDLAMKAVKAFSIDNVYFEARLSIAANAGLTLKTGATIQFLGKKHSFRFEITVPPSLEKLKQAFVKWCKGTLNMPTKGK